MNRKNLQLHYDNSQGVAALPVIIAISLIILVIAIGIASSSYIENSNSYAELNNKDALFAAEAGARDAYKRIILNNNCNNITGNSSCSNYALAVGVATSTITVTGGSSSKTILSIGNVNNVSVKIQVTVAIDNNNKVTQTSWQQLIQ